MNKNTTKLRNKQASLNGQNLSEKVYGPKVGKNGGWVVRTKVISYNAWYFRRVLKPLERELLQMILDQAKHGSDKPWQIDIALSWIANYMGIPKCSLSKPFKTLTSKILYCPICGDSLGTILKAERPKHMAYTIDATPFKEMLIHIQDHRGDRKEADYERKKATWIEEKKDKKRVTSMKKNKHESKM